jgi:hypothetical protein
MKTITDEQIGNLITNDEVREMFWELFTAETGNIEDNKELFVEMTNEFLIEHKINVTVTDILTVTEDGEVTWIL